MLRDISYLDWTAKMPREAFRIDEVHYSGHIKITADAIEISTEISEMSVKLNGMPVQGTAGQAYLTFEDPVARTPSFDAKMKPPTIRVSFPLDQKALILDAVGRPATQIIYDEDGARKTCTIAFDGITFNSRP
ncbi:hypothetical protein N9W17_00735 [Jannaschia sp.]|nr:hypothetical protein [Jannaschia sp.]